MGHITFTGASMEEVLGRAAALDLVPQPTPKVWAMGTAGGGAARVWPRFRNQKHASIGYPQHCAQRVFHCAPHRTTRRWSGSSWAATATCRP
jgi:hypothetical protein